MKNSMIPVSGSLIIPMTNDYLFRALLQQNNKVLKGLISSLLHFAIEEIVSIEITNPIELGFAVDAKEFFLDIKVLLNSNTTINLEMQVVNEHNWPERSLSYLCRSYDGLNRGSDYIDAKSAIQIGLLNFTLFPDYPEFYAAYQLLNVKNYIKYSDKLSLYVLDLTHIDLATEEDIHYQINDWAAFFKASTWEELNMIAEKNEYIEEAVETLYRLSGDEKIRQLCEAREDYYRRQRDAEILKQRFEKRVQEHEQRVQEHEQRVQEHEQRVQEHEQRVQEHEQQVREHEQRVQEHEQQVREHKQRVQEHEQQMQEHEHRIQEKEQQIQAQEQLLLELEAKIRDWQNKINS